MLYKRMNIIIPFCFFFSGLAGLIYEVLWAKYLSLIFGNTTYAHTLVLATFMGGLALGNFLFGKFSDRSSNPLLLYVRLELGIGITGICTPFLFAFSKNIYLALAHNLSLGSFEIVLLKFIVGALIMLPPTILMGGTLPTLSKFLIRNPIVRGETVAKLYYINSLGAVAGTLLAGFYLIYKFGLNFSITAAAAFNILPAAAIYILQFFSKAPTQVLSDKEATFLRKDVIKDELFPPRIIAISLVAIFLSGFIAMLYEIAWIRLLSVILGCSTYSFSLMLAAFISGITLGSYIVHKKMPRSETTFLAFGICEILIGVSLLLFLPFYDRLPYVFLVISSEFVKTTRAFPINSFVNFLLSFLVMLPPTIFLGMTLPLVSKIASGELKLLGKKVGNVFALNTLGNILGALIVGLSLLPLLGIQKIMEIGILCNITIGLVIVLADIKFLKKYKYTLTITCLLLFFSYKLFAPQWDYANFTAQVFRMSGISDDFNYKKFSESVHANSRRIVFYEDGIDTTVAVVKQRDLTALFVGGKADASVSTNGTTNDMPTQMLSAHIPLILKPRVQNVLIVGLGSGVTCGSALQHPIKNVDLIEISPSVVKANKYFRDVNHNALDDKRVHVHIEDAKTFIQRTTKKYDAIICEPSNPWMSGIATLYSEEYFKECVNHLTEDGIMLQWLQLYDLDDETYKIVLNTFCSAFPYVSIWTTGINDSFLIGSKQALDIDFNASKARMAETLVQRDLSLLKMKDLFTLLCLQLTSDNTIRTTLAQYTRTNSDYFPYLEYRAPVNLHTHAIPLKFIDELEERNVPLSRSNLLVKKYLDNDQLDTITLRNLLIYLNEYPYLEENLLSAVTWRLHKEVPSDSSTMQAYALHNKESLFVSLEVLESLILKEKQFQYVSIYADLLTNKCKSYNTFLTPDIFTDVSNKLKTCIEHTPPDKQAFLYNTLGELNMKVKDRKNAINYLKKTEELTGSAKKSEMQNIDYLTLLCNICSNYLAIGDYPDAVNYIKKIMQQEENNAFAHQAIQYIRYQLSVRNAAPRNPQTP